MSKALAYALSRNYFGLGFNRLTQIVFYNLFVYFYVSSNISKRIKVIFVGFQHDVFVAYKILGIKTFPFFNQNTNMLVVSNDYD